MYKSGFVAVVGSPNAGKSTMINAIIGRKVSIVTDKAQTTRDLIKGIYTDDKRQIVFLDTPGFHKPFNKLNVYMNYKIDEAFHDVDLVVYVLDAKFGLGKKEQENIERLKKLNNVNIVCIINKLDLVSQEKALKIVEQLNDLEMFKEVIATSFTTNKTFGSIIELIDSYLPEHEKFYDEDDFYDYSDEFYISEIIREKVFQLTSQELPHSVGVKVNEIAEEEGKLFIEADIFVERKSQKTIIVGKAGAMIKEIGTRARKELKREFKQSIYLDLQVKVLNKWGQKDDYLEMVGYEID